MSNLSDEAIKAALSLTRISTYELAVQDQPLKDALHLYAWNAQVAAAMLSPLHICEVVIRNAASDAISFVYGAEWPWSEGFLKSLPNPKVGYNPRKDLTYTRQGKTSVGKVIPELKFVFWQTLFTKRFDHRLWSHHLHCVMPHLDKSLTINELRQLIYGELEQLRKLRNRIAHHEPIFRRNIGDDLQKAHDLITIRCPVTALWMMSNQQATVLIADSPLLLTMRS